MHGEVETRRSALETLGFRCSVWGYEADRWWKQLYLPNEITSLDTEDGLDNGITGRFAACRNSCHVFHEYAMCQPAVLAGAFCQGQAMQEESGNINSGRSMKCTICHHLVYAGPGFLAG